MRNNNNTTAQPLAGAITTMKDGHCLIYCIWHALRKKKPVTVRDVHNTIYMSYRAAHLKSLHWTPAAVWFIHATSSYGIYAHYSGTQYGQLRASPALKSPIYMISMNLVLLLCFCFSYPRFFLYFVSILIMCGWWKFDPIVPLAYQCLCVLLVVYLMSYKWEWPSS